MGGRGIGKVGGGGEGGVMTGTGGRVGIDGRGGINPEGGG